MEFKIGLERWVGVAPWRCSRARLEKRICKGPALRWDFACSRQLVWLGCREGEESGNWKCPHYAGLLGYIKNLRLDSKNRGKPCKTLTQERDTIRPCSWRRKETALAAWYGEWMSLGVTEVSDKIGQLLWVGCCQGKWKDVDSDFIDQDKKNRSEVIFAGWSSSVFEMIELGVWRYLNCNAKWAVGLGRNIICSD